MNGAVLGKHTCACGHGSLSHPGGAGCDLCPECPRYQPRGEVTVADVHDVVVDAQRSAQEIAYLTGLIEKALANVDDATLTILHTMPLRALAQRELEARTAKARERAIDANAKLGVLQSALASLNHVRGGS